MSLGRQRGEWNLAHLGHDLHALFDIPEHERVVEPRHGIVPPLGDYEHLLQFVHVPSDQIQERQRVEVLRLLVHHLHDLLVALAQGLKPQAVPAGVIVKLLRCGHGLLDVAILQGQIEASLLILHKLQGYLREALLLKVADHGVAAEPAILYPHLHISELAMVQRQLEEVLGAIEPFLFHLVFPIDPPDVLLVHPHNVDGAGERMDDAAVAIGQAVLHVTQGRVNEDPVLVPCATLHADVLMERVQVLQVLAGHQNIVLRHEGDIVSALRPHYISHAARDCHFVHGLPCRQVVEDDLLLALQQDPVVPTGEDVVRGHRRLKLLGQLVLQVVDPDRAALLQHREAVPGCEADGLSVALLRRHIRV
mmetsp:Transcript_11593/g.24461  ORF Transcript_11593/g.24461 Transcript_11593/m.24461 type:complete len:364 (-) Transcript_11593:1285-2376(-)